MTEKFAYSIEVKFLLWKDDSLCPGAETAIDQCHV